MTSSNHEFHQYIAIACGAALMASVLLLAPAVAGQLVQKLGFSPQQVGWTISAELAGLSLASLPAFYWLKRVSWRKVLFISLLAVAIGNLISTQLEGFVALASVRFLTALFAGNVMVITMQTAASMTYPARSYSIWVIGQLVLGAIGLAVLPLLFTQYGLPALYLLLCAMSLLLLFTVGYYPDGFIGNSSATVSATLTAKWVLVVALLGLAFFYIAIGGVWTFVEQIAINRIEHTSEAEFRQRIGLILSIATVAGIVSAGLASLMGASNKQLRWVLVGSGMLSLSIALLLLNMNIERFSASVILFKFTWTFTLPFILAGFAALDRSGFLVTASNVIIGGGLAFGPIVAGYLIANAGGGFNSMSTIMLVLSLAAACLLYIALRWGSRSQA